MFLGAYAGVRACTFVEVEKQSLLSVVLAAISRPLTASCLVCRCNRFYVYEVEDSEACSPFR